MAPRILDVGVRCAGVFPTFRRGGYILLSPILYSLFPDHCGFPPK